MGDCYVATQEKVILKLYELVYIHNHNDKV